jgi:uncharacterized protein (DUF433 family)
MKYFDRTTVDPNAMGGRPCIRNTKITVALILNLLSNSLSFDDIIPDYPIDQQIVSRKLLTLKVVILKNY